MNTVAQPEIIGLDVSRDWLDIHCLSDDRRLRLPNTDEGHSKLEEIAAGREALVCFEAAGGHEWRLWANMAAAGIEARQFAPAQAEAFGRSRGTSAKTDRIDAELIARFMAFRPEAGRRLPSGRLRDPGTPATKRRQLVEMRKSARQQAKADLRNGAAESVEDLTGELLELLERQISEVEERIAGLLANDAVLAETAAILQSVPGIGPVACAMPVARDSGQMRGKRMIGGGRRSLRQVLHQAALAASIRNTDLKLFADRLRKEGKPHKVVVTAVARKLVVIANALCKSRRPWAYQQDTLDSAFRPSAACCRAAEGSAEPDNPQISGRSAGFQRSNRQPLLGILEFRVAWTIFAPQMQRNRTIRTHGMITESCVGN